MAASVGLCSYFHFLILPQDKGYLHLRTPLRSARRFLIGNIKANVEEVSNKIDILKGLTVYGKKMLATGFVDTKVQIEKFTKQYKDFQGISKLRLYKATPIQVWKLAPSEVFNEKYVDSRIEVQLKNETN